MTQPARTDLSAIIQTIREVEETIDRRAQRAAGATMLVWGIAATAIFAFYHAIATGDALGHAVGQLVARWFWVPPVALAYAATVVLGARLGRAVPDAQENRSIRWLLLALIPPLGVLVYVQVTGNREEFVPGMWVAFLGIAHLLFRRGNESAFPPWLCNLAVYGSFALGLALLALHPWWGNAAAGVWYALALAALGAVKYHAAR